MSKFNFDDIPLLPGCYLWKDKNDKVIYVGKAKNLKNRLTSYLKPSHSRTKLLINEATSFDFITTKTELDSLLLEQTLINKYEPKYNIKIKFSGTYPYIELATLSNKIEVKIARKLNRRKQSMFFGPFPEGFGSYKIVSLLNDIYPIRKCLHPNSGKPCLYYQMGLCMGMCFKKVTLDDYKPYRDEIIKFLKGDITNIKEKVFNKMTSLSDSLDFELARKYSELLGLIDKYSEKITTQFNDYKNRDIFAYYVKDDYISISISFIRFGKLINLENFSLLSTSQNYEDDVLTFIIAYYKDMMKPDILHISFDRELLSNVLEIEVKNVDRGKVKILFEQTFENARRRLENEYLSLKTKNDNYNNALSELESISKLSSINEIELVDASSFKGDSQIGVVVNYLNGQKNSSKYRKYKLDDIKGMNDYASIKEVTYRHFRKKLINNEPIPDLYIVDGKYQVRGAKKALNELNINNIKVIGLVKNRKHDTEGIFIDDKVIPVDQKNKLYLVLGSMQDEVHRYAIAFHKQRRTKNIIKSELNEIKELSDVDINNLYLEFENLRKIKLATPKELEKAITHKKALRVEEFFKNKN